MQHHTQTKRGFTHAVGKAYIRQASNWHAGGVTMHKPLAANRDKIQLQRGFTSSYIPRTFGRLTCNVLAPPKQQTSKSHQEVATEETNIWRSASQLVNGLRIWSPAQDSVQQVPAVQQQQQQDLSTSVGAVPPPLLDCNAFLGTCSDDELRNMRMLAHLCAQTYYMGLLTPRKLKLWHNLDLISTSLCCERLVYEHTMSDQEVMMEGDGMAGPGVLDALDIYSSSSSSGSDPSSQTASSNSHVGQITSATATANNVLPFPAAKAVLVPVGDNKRTDASPGAVRAAAAAFSAAAVAQQSATTQQAAEAATTSSNSNISKSKRSNWSPAELVAAKLSEAAAAASAAAQPLASAAQAAAGTLYAGSMSLVSSVTSTVTSTVITSQMPALGPGADKVLRDTIAGITTAEIASSHPNSKDVKAASTSSGSRCPSEWFVADSEAYNTRYFVIQGSDSIEHWKTNLMFEPVPFEGAELGIRVHRGAYEAAQALYERFLPLVQEHVDKDPTAKVCFTGHSIGGAMAVLLMLMFRHRGVLLPQQIAPVYTFGAPSLFCDGALSACSGCSIGADGTESCRLGGTLLARLGLGDDAIRSVIMTRDIVPRAFSCDYALVADLLRSWGPSWKEHSCLAGGVNGSGRRQLYVHIGRMFVLQPSPELKFITEPNPHLPVLPQRADVYELMPRPTLASAMAAARHRAVQSLLSLNELNDVAGKSSAVPSALQPGVNPTLNLLALGRPAKSSEEVLAAIMDCPHPLETLGDPGAYGNLGSISRYHNPDNYCMALGRLLAERREAAAASMGHKARFVVPRRAARHRPFFPPQSPAAETSAAIAE